MDFQVLFKTDIDEINRKIINDISNLSFPIHNNHKDFVSLCKDDSCICLLKKNTEIVSVGYLDFLTKDVIHPLSTRYISIHSLSVHPNHRGKGYCKVMINKIKHKYNRTPLCLTVCTAKKNPNIPGIKCYQRCGFKLIDMCHIDNYDGVNTYMTYHPHQKKTKRTKKTKKTKKTKRTKRKKKISRKKSKSLKK